MLMSLSERAPEIAFEERAPAIAFAGRDGVAE